MTVDWFSFSSYERYIYQEDGWPLCDQEVQDNYENDSGWMAISLVVAHQGIDQYYHD